MKVAMISDVHGKWHDLKVPECDLLISAGDYSFVGEQSLVRGFHRWLSEQPAKHVISVQGNHEVWVQSHWNLAKQIAEENCPRVHFIDEGPLEIMGKKIWCSAITPWFHDWAWNRQRGGEIKKHWDKIPDDTEILVTHGPPYGILDQIEGHSEHLGCLDLYARICELRDLQLHVFGHIHSASGEDTGISDSTGKEIRFVNAATVDESYRPAYPVRFVDLP